MSQSAEAAVLLSGTQLGDQNLHVRQVSPADMGDTGKSGGKGNLAEGESEVSKALAKLREFAIPTAAQGAEAAS